MSSLFGQSMMLSPPPPEYGFGSGTRNITYDPSQSCNDCALPSLVWDAWSEEYTGICPTCNRVNDGQLKTHIEECYPNGRCSCGCGGQLMCTCLCECVDDDDSGNDTDFEVCEAPDDDVENALMGKAKAAENVLARQIGWERNYICNIGDDNERAVCYEGPGHHAMAHQHDIGIPAESSLANSDNSIGLIEAQSLNHPLEPWELEAVHLSTGRPYLELLQTFPRIHNMPIPTNRRPELTPSERTIICDECNKPRTEEWLEATRRGQLSACNFCGVTRKPDDPTDDPDWQNFPYDTSRLLDFCLCRCSCGVTDADLNSPSLRTDSAFEEAASGARPSSEPVQLTLTFITGRRRSLDDNFDANLAPYDTDGMQMDVIITPEDERTGSIDRFNSNPRFEADRMEMDTDYRGPPTSTIRERPASVVRERPNATQEPILIYRDPEEQDRLRTAFNLPEARFSDSTDSYQATIDDVMMALEDARAAQAFKVRSEALNGVSMAISIGQQRLGPYHPLMIEASNLAMELSRMEMEV